jgi:hypothetical protein
MKISAAFVAAALHLCTTGWARAQNAPEYTQMESLIQQNTRGIGDAVQFNQAIKPAIQDMTKAVVDNAGSSTFPSVPSVGSSSASELMWDAAREGLKEVAPRPGGNSPALGEVERQASEDAARVSQASASASDPNDSGPLGNLIAQRNCQFNPATCPAPTQGKPSPSIDNSPFPNPQVDKSLPACGFPPPFVCNPIGNPYSLIASSPIRSFTNECGPSEGVIDANTAAGHVIELIDCILENKVVVPHIRSRVGLGSGLSIVPVTRLPGRINYSGYRFASRCVPCGVGAPLAPVSPNAAQPAAAPRPSPAKKGGPITICFFGNCP